MILENPPKDPRTPPPLLQLSTRHAMLNVPQHHQPRRFLILYNFPKPFQHLAGLGRNVNALLRKSNLPTNVQIANNHNPLLTMTQQEGWFRSNRLARGQSKSLVPRTQNPNFTTNYVFLSKDL